ncbi:MAG: thiamine phosphate synthase [Parvibaculum sp.]|nr:thiamine phosphate synthase [Parvibaculum sp.]
MAEARKNNLAPRPSLPTRLALTDPLRQPDPFALLASLPKGTGMIWRAYDTGLTRQHIRALERRARAKHITLLIASTRADTRRLRFSNRHLPEHQLEKTTYTDKITTAAAHSHRAIIAAARAGVDAVLISPVFATQSHKGAKPLGVIRFAMLAHLARTQGLAVYALGGLTNDKKIRRLNGSAPISITGIGIAGIGLFHQSN